MAVGEIDILIPEATKNLVLNPSPEKNLNNWVPSWNQEATLEDQETTPNPTGFDAINGAVSITSQAAIRGKWGMQCDLNAPPPAVGVSYGYLNDPDSEDEIVSEMYINTNNIAAVGGSEFWRIMQTQGTLPTTLAIDDNAGVLRLNVIYNEDGGGTTLPIMALDQFTTYKVRLHQRYASAPAANDGFVRVYVNDVLELEANNLDSDTGAVTAVWYGGVGMNNFSGTLFADNCRWADTDVPFTGCSVERSMERARFGRYSIKVYTDGYSLHEGIFSRVDSTGVQGMVTASAYLRGNGDVRIRLYDGLTGRQSYSQPISLQDKYWQRIEVQGTAMASDDLRVYIETDGNVAQEVIFYVDGVQIEEKEEMTTYCDGTQPGCRWNGVSYATTSEREATEMNGGTWTPIREDPCNPDTYFTNMFGFGMPPLTINRQRMALSPGSFFDSERVEERPFGITVTVKDPDARRRDDRQIQKIWDLRQRLQDMIKPDNNPDNEPFWLRYRQDGRYLMIRAIYESGLEFEGDVRNKFFNQIPLRFLALDPFWYEDSQEVAILDTENTLNGTYYLMAKQDGDWSIIANELNQSIQAIDEDANGRIYIGGNFTADGDGNNLRRFAYLDDTYENFIEAGTGVDSVVLDVKVHPNGNVYICGQFANDNSGNPMVRVAEYDPDTDTLTAMGAGLNGNAFGLDVGPNGWVYVCGSFTTAGGNPAPYAAYWDGLQWHSVGDFTADIAPDGVIATGYTILVRDTDDIYMGGQWTVGGGGTDYRYDYHFDGTNWSELTGSNAAHGPAGNTNRPTNIMIFDKDGTVLIGHDTLNTETKGFLRWNGSAYVAIGGGFERVLPATNPTINALAVDIYGNIVLGGRFAVADEVTTNLGAALFNGSTFARLDLNVPGQDNLNILAVLARANGDLWLGFSTIQGQVIETSGVTVVECRSTTETFVILSVTGPGTITWFENQNADIISYFDYELQADELLEVDYRVGIKSVQSNYRGSVPNAILSNSEDIFLLAGKMDEPSQNRIALFIIDEVEPTAQLRYIPTHWSIDALSTL